MIVTAIAVAEPKAVKSALCTDAVVHSPGSRTVRRLSALCYPMAGNGGMTGLGRDFRGFEFEPEH
jgi:hypothetical protein